YKGLRNYERNVSHFDESPRREIVGWKRAGMRLGGYCIMLGLELCLCNSNRQSWTSVSRSLRKFWDATSLPKRDTTESKNPQEWRQKDTQHRRCLGQALPLSSNWRQAVRQS